jgi:hypothetical protein
VFPPFFDDDLRFAERVENLAVQQFVAHSAVETFAVSVFPGTARLDECGLCANSVDPFPDVFGDEVSLIAPLVRATMANGPLSDLMNAGTARRMNRSDSASMTSTELSLRFTLIARHSRVNSSRMFSVLNALPSSVRQWTKSYDQT